MTNGLDFPARRDQRSVSAQIPAEVQGVGVQRVGAMLTVRVHLVVSCKEKTLPMPERETCSNNQVQQRS